MNRELVDLPGDVLGVEQVGDGGHVGRNLVPVVVVHAKVVTTSGSTVVGLRGVGDGEVVGEQDTLLGQLREVGVGSNVLKVGVFEPDVDEAVEGQTLNVRGRAQGLGGGSSRFHLGGGRVLDGSRGHSQGAGNAGKSLLVEHGGDGEVHCGRMTCEGRQPTLYFDSPWPLTKKKTNRGPSVSRD